MPRRFTSSSAARRRAACLVLTLLASASALSATTFTSSWTGTSSGDWFTSTRWVSTPFFGLFPANSATDSFDVNVSGTMSVSRSVNVTTPWTWLGVQNDFLAINSLTISSALTTVYQYGAASDLRVTGALTISAGAYSIAGGALSAGSLVLTGGGLDLSGGSGATFTVGSVSMTGGTLAVGAGSMNAGSVTLSGGAFGVGTGSLAAGALTVTNGASLSAGTGQIGATSVALNGGALDLTAGATLTSPAVVVNGGGTLKVGAGVVAPTSLTLNGGTVVGGSVVTTGAGQLHLTNSASVFDGTLLAGGLAFDQDNGRVVLRNHASFGADGATLGKTANYLSFQSTDSNGGNVTDATVSSPINMDGLVPSILLEGPGGGITVKLDTNGAIRGRGIVYSGGSYAGVFGVKNRGTISADLAGQTLAFQPHFLINESGGLIRALNGATLTINPQTNFTNQAGGTLSITGGSNALLLQNWHNSGALILGDTSTLTLAGNGATLADLGLAGWSRPNGGGTVFLQASVDLQGQTFAFGPATGDFRLLGGSLKNGAISSSAGGRLVYDNNSANALDGVTHAGSLVLDQPFGKLRLRNDATAGGDITLSGPSATIGFEGTATDPTAVFSHTINMDNANARVSLEGIAPSLTLAPGAIIRGMGTMPIGAFNGVVGLAEVTNDGLVSADVPGQSLTLSPLKFTNEAGATVRAINGATLVINPGTSFSSSVSTFDNLAGGTLSVSGGSVLTLQRAWHNAGALSIADTSTLLLQGNFTTADLGLDGWTRPNGGGTVKLQGTLDNTGATLDLALAGTVVIDGGVIRGGLVTASGTNALRPVNNGFSALDGATYQGPLLLDQNFGKLRLRNDAAIVAKFIDFTGTNCVLGFEATASDATATLSGAVVNLGGSGNQISLMGPSPVLTLAAGAVVRGVGAINANGYSGTPTLINEGRILADVFGQSLQVTVPALSNLGVLAASNGATLAFPATLAQQAAGVIQLAGGYLQITNSVSGPDLSLGAAASLEGFGEVRLATPNVDALALAGTLSPDPGAGGLVIKGDLVPAASATLVFDIAGAAQGTGYDFVSEAGGTALNLNGCTLKLRLAKGYAPGAAQTFTILTSNQTITGAFGNIASGARLVTSDGYGSFVVNYAGSNAVTLSDFQATPQAAFLAWIQGLYRGSTDPVLVGATADPDGDGVANWQEFALGGDPTSIVSRGLSAALRQDIDPAPGAEFTYVIACRAGAVFAAQPGGPQATSTPVDAVSYTVEAGADLQSWGLPVLHAGPSFVAPAASGLPDLTGTGWEYHTFYVNPAQAGARVFLRLRLDFSPAQ